MEINVSVVLDLEHNNLVIMIIYKIQNVLVILYIYLLACHYSCYTCNGEQYN